MNAGARLGAYEIVALVGSGGMGEVYRARDSRLGRDVAIKVLPASVSADPEALGRFEREARAVGALSHPNIVSIHDVGTDGGVSYVVMELLEGETLRSRLTASASALPRAKALEIAIQIAHGLAAAHGKGIVHRDLKPENVFLTPDGRVKILDFGLARALPSGVQAISNADTVMSPTVTAASVPGMILGTVGYMSPEQVRGQPADHRADIFAFGAVLFEMLTGERAFGGDSAIEMMSAILKQDPLEQPAAAITVSGPLGPLLRHCLEKQPDERFQSARDLAFQLQVIAGSSGATSSSAAGHAAPDIPRRARGWLVPAAIALVAAVAGLELGRYLFAADATELTSVTSTVLLPAGVRIDPGANPARSGGLAVSRDGRQIAFVGQTPTGTQVFVRAIDSPVARPVAGTEDGALPAWSPDGKRLAFWQGRQLKQISADGGAPQVITEMINPRSAATWGTDDTLLFHVEYRQGLLRVPVAGGTPSEVLPVGGGDVSWFSPVWLPDGRRFLVVRFAYGDTEKGAGIYAGSVDSKDVTLIVPGSIAEVAVGDQELFYRKGTELIAQPFDTATLKVSGNPRAVSSHVSMVAAGGPTLVYFDPPGGLSMGHRITWFSRSGAVLSTTGEPSSFRDPRISPDERSIVIARANETGVFGLWKYDIARNIDTKITGTTYVSPAWTRDSRSIIVGSSAKGVERFDASASGPPQLLTASYWAVLDVTGAGEVLVRQGQPVKFRLAVMRLDGSADPKPVSADLYGAVSASFSFDGKWIAMVGAESREQGRLHVQPYPGPGARIPVSAMIASHPRWRRDGGELYFTSRVDGQQAIMAVPVTWNGGVPDFGATQLLFKVPKIVAVNLAFDVSADGQRFVVIVGNDLDPSPLTMVVRSAVR